MVEKWKFPIFHVLNFWSVPKWLNSNKSKWKTNIFLNWKAQIFADSKQKRFWSWSCSYAANKTQHVRYTWPGGCSCLVWSCPHDLQVSLPTWPIYRCPCRCARLWLAGAANPRSATCRCMLLIGWKGHTPTPGSAWIVHLTCTSMQDIELERHFLNTTKPANPCPPPSSPQIAVLDLVKTTSLNKSTNNTNLEWDGALLTICVKLMHHSCLRNNAKRWGVGCVTRVKGGRTDLQVQSTEEFVTHTFLQVFTQPTPRLFALFLLEIFGKTFVCFQSRSRSVLSCLKMFFEYFYFKMWNYASQNFTLKKL